MKKNYLALIVTAALAAATVAAAADADTNSPNAGPPDANAASTNEPVPLPANAAATNGVVIPTNAPATNALDIVETNEEDVTPTNQVRLNFHDAPLNMVLNYLSKRMGFAIDSQVEVRGNVTIVSEQPVGTNEVMELLSAALAKDNYNISRNGRILTITSASGAITAPSTKVLTEANATNIPPTDEVATYILPVHTLNPGQLVKDLSELIPPGATVSANEAGNAVIMTARKKDVRRFCEIINALDGSSVSQVDVFILNYADAKSVASELKEVFQSPDSTVARSDARTRFQGRGGGGGFMNAIMGGGGGGGESSDEKNASNKAVFTSDDQMNAVIASAPPDYFRQITNVIYELDQPSQEITEMRVFKLKYADPQEIADELGTLFPDPTQQAQSSQRSMGMRFVPPWMQQQQSAGAGKSQRMTIQSLVRAVPDVRTARLTVATSKQLMEQISNMIEVLDSDPAQVQHQYVFNLNSADPVVVQAAMAALFSGPNTKAQTTSSANQSALQQRSQSTAQQQSTSSSTTGFGSTGVGGTTGSH